MLTETLTCSGCGAPLQPQQTTSVKCDHCGRLNYVRAVDARGPMAEIDLRVEGASARFTDDIVITTSAPAGLGVTSMVGSSITGSLSISLARGDLRGRSFDMHPKSRADNAFVINLIDMSVPTTFTNLWSTLPGPLDNVPELGGMIHVEQFDLTTGQTKLELVDVRLASVSSPEVCTISGSIHTFRSTNPLVVSQ